MRIDEAPRLGGSLGEFLLAFSRHWLRLAQQVNALSEGGLSAVHNAAINAPTAGKFVAGDVIRNAAPSESGTAGSKYVVTGWICTVSGSPGTWVETRSLTGN